MKPFLHNELFAVSNKVNVNSFNLGDMPLVIIDNIFENFESLRDMVLQCPAGNWKYVEGGKNYVDYYDCRLAFPNKQESLYNAASKIIHKMLNKTTQYQGGSLDVNWFKQINDKRSDYAFPHSDQITKEQQYTCLVYLNCEEECSGGTAFFKNKIINSVKHNGDISNDDVMTKFYNENPGSLETGLDYWCNDDVWEMISYVDMKPNRMVIFPANYFHAAYHPINSFFEYPRMTLVFWMNDIKMENMND